APAFILCGFILAGGALAYWLLMHDVVDAPAWRARIRTHEANGARYEGCVTEPRGAFADGDADDRYMGRWSRALGDRCSAGLESPPNRRWLDVGCGTGACTELIVSHAAPDAIVGIDPAPAQVEHAKRTVTAPQADFRVASAIDLPFGTGEFDVVVSALAIH